MKEKERSLDDKKIMESLEEVERFLDSLSHC
jgi:hypothetical protein